MKHAAAQKNKKGEDVIIMHPDQVLHDVIPKGAVSSFSLWAVADGHNGAGAAQHCQAALCDELMHRLPRCLPPADGSPGVLAT